MDNKREIQKVWSAEQEILDVIHKVCLENNLRYSLAYGTLIGAVRHKGFIPWDDDIDIMMPREDYEKLLQIWSQSVPNNYILQDYHTDNDYTNNFAKIRKDHTTFLQTEDERSKKYHKGIFVDIFPGDRMPTNFFLQKIQYIFFAINLLYSRGYRSGSKGVIGIIERILLLVPKRYYFKLRDKAESIMKYWNNQNGEYIFANTIRECKKLYPDNMFDNLQNIEFNGKSYYSVKDIDKILCIKYGNYMQLPPENERIWKHHPIIVDFEHNYEELGECNDEC